MVRRGGALPRPAHFFFLPPAGYFLSLAKESNQRTPFKERGISISPERALRVRPTIFAKQKSVFRLNAKETPDGFLSHYLPFRRLSVCAALPLWKHPPGRRACGRGDADCHASDIGHWRGNDTAARCAGRTGASASTDGHKGCGGKTAGRCTPRVLASLRSTAWASPPTEGSKGCGAKQEFGYRFLAGDVVQWRQGIPGKEFPLCWIFLTYSGR